MIDKLLKSGTKGAVLMGIATVALWVVAISDNTTCFFIAHEM
ncbi:MAG: AgrD family cyclic lactone autoinducer peptide [Lachnospirales bacterium]